MLAAVVLGLVAFGVSLLTLFTGFGLGTLLMPVFALFFPVEVAVASTAVVHAANNLFKVGLLARAAPREILVRFGVTAVAGSFCGAFALSSLSELPQIGSWSLGGVGGELSPVDLVMGMLILGFALVELVPALRRLRVSPRWLPLGGAVSGFFGGLSGHQGALRAAFLAPLGLEPTQFVATQAVLALLVDAARLTVYGLTFATLGGLGSSESIPWHLVALATLCAFAGAFLGKRLLPKITLGALHQLVGGLLLLVGASLALGIT